MASSGRSSGSGGTPWPRVVPIRSISRRAPANGRPYRSPRLPGGWTSWRTACWRSASARATRSGSSPGRASSGASSTSRSRSSVASPRRSMRTRRPRTAATSSRHSDAVGVLVEDEEQLEKVEAVRGELPGLEHVLTFADLDGLAERGRAFAAEQPTALAEAESQDRRGRPLHVHLHVGHDRAAQGLQDPPPQLLRDGEGRERHGRRLPGGRPAAALSAARAQLRPPHAPPRADGRLHDRLLRRSVRRRRCAAQGEADGLPERAARVREDPHGCRRQVRRGHGRPAKAHRLGARRRATGERAAPAGPADPAWPRRRSTASPTGSCTRR